MLFFITMKLSHFSLLRNLMRVSLWQSDIPYHVDIMRTNHQMREQRLKPRRFLSAMAAALLPFILIADAAAQAQLFIHPTLVMFSGTHRNDVVHVVNQGDATGVFELEWRDSAMTPDGGLAESDSDAPWSLQPLARFSPRRVTLRPGETQLVRIALRPARDVAEGEYYSHLRVVTMEDDLEAAVSDGTTGDEAITIEARTAIAIPVVWRNSDALPRATIESASLDPDRNVLVVELRRLGKLSTRGYLHVVTEEGAGFRAVADPVPLVIYPSAERRTAVIPLKAAKGSPAARMQVIYTADPEMDSTSSAYATFSVRH